MDRQLENSNLKRENDEENSDQNKRKKPEVPEVAAATTNLTDVNDDCLVHIFKHLLLPDLINVADTCKRIQASAQTVFAAMCRGKVIQLHPTRLNQSKPITSDKNTVASSDLTSCLKMLRHFGVKISKLYIILYSCGKDEKATLIWYMNEYCTDSLVDLRIYNAADSMAIKWTKPLKNVESVKLYDCDLSDLSVWFPNVYRLLLYNSPQSIKSTFPHLEELEIHMQRNAGERARTMELLRLNQHLQILRLSGFYCDMKFMESIIEYLQSIKLLDIKCHREFFNTDGITILLKSVTEFHINLIRFDTLPKIPFKFDQLETIKLMCRKFELNDNFKNFIGKHPSLKKLTIQTWGYTLNSSLIEQIKSDLAEVSPSLVVEIIAKKF